MPVSLRPLIASTRAFALGLVALLLAVAGLVVAPCARADGDVSWAVRTASNQFGADRQNFSYTVDPGGHIDDALVVSNRGTGPLALSVYAADGFTTAAGQLDLVTPATQSKALGVWVRPSVGQLMVQPGESVDVPFTMDVPGNATPGDYMGGVVTSLVQAGQGSQINVDRRLAIRIKLRVGGELAPKMSIEDLRVSYSGAANPLGKGDATLTYTIRNSGNAILTARQSASVSGPFGLLRVRADAIDDSQALLPGDTWKVAVPLHDVTPALRLAATVTVTPLVTDASGTIAPLPTISDTAHAWTVPWVLLVLVLALVGLAAWRLIARRSARRAAGVSRADRRPHPAVQ